MEIITFAWKPIPSLPPKNGEKVQPGLAGVVAGSVGDYLIVAGGANFIHGLPWEGGIKEYHGDIYLLRKSAGGSFIWEADSMKLPENLAYAASVSTSAGVVGIGGENAAGPVRKVLLLSCSKGRVIAKNLPDLPVAITSGGAAAICSMVYFAGGLDPGGAVATFYCLNLNALEDGWIRLPDLPVALSHSVVVAQDDESGTCIYVIGGRNKTGEESAFQGIVWKFSPFSGIWTHDSDIRREDQPLMLSAGAGVAAGKHSIVLFGGDKGVIFNQTERLNSAIEKSAGEERRIFLERKDSLLRNHPGFNRGILVYNTISKSFKYAGDIPADGPVTTTAVRWQGMVVIPSGEIRPGIRTALVLGVETGITE
jgi:cyclically-permuted mutarotase family protein